MQDKRVINYIQEAKKVLVNKGVLKATVLQKKIQPHDSHAADNFDWRYLVAGTLLR
jgi:asparagine synthase (glutamine-hydrolysing)